MRKSKAFRVLSTIIITGLLINIIGCAGSPPMAPEPKGAMQSINKFHPITGEVIKNVQ